MGVDFRDLLTELKGHENFLVVFR